MCKTTRKKGHRIIIVTSGAIAAGREYLNYPDLPATIASKQLLAAVGQKCFNSGMETAICYLWYSYWAKCY